MTTASAARARFFDRKAVWPQPLILDGLSRTGKFLLGRFVSHFERVEYFQYAHNLEHIPIFWRLGGITEEAAVLLLRINVDVLIYEKAVGRNLNTREEDVTSIHRAPDPERYLKRTRAPRGIAALAELETERRYPSFLTHEVLPNVRLFLKTYPEMRMVNMQRHPVDLAHSWHRQNYSVKFGNDPLLFYPFLAGRKMAAPWWVESWIEEYEEMAPIDREIGGVLDLCRLEQEAFLSLSESEKKQIHFVCLEQLLADPRNSIERTAAFLGSKALPSMTAALAAEGCGQGPSPAERGKKLNEIVSLCSPQSAQRLTAAARQYEKKWGLS